MSKYTLGGGVEDIASYGFLLLPTGNEREVEEDDGEHPDNVTPSEEDDILYTEGEEAVVDDATTLLFIHQSEQQLQILKRSD